MMRLSRFHAQMTLFPTEQGGRAGPLPRNKWRTIVAIGDQRHSCEIHYWDQPAAPGCTVSVTVQLLTPTNHLPAHMPLFERGQVGFLSLATAA